MAHVDRKQYWVIWVWLFALTMLEVGVVYVPIEAWAMTSALVSMAAVKAGLVGLFYMHLKHETKILQWGVTVPMAIPVLYACVLVLEGAFRMLR
jgi:caa(3)-type oxidase subunit IV